MTPFTTDWFLAYQQRINSDTEMAVVGRWFTASFWVTAESRRTILRFERGALTAFVEAPRLDERADFGFRASEDVWTRFLSAKPQPLYHDFFAMLMRVPAFVIEGDTLVAMQHARALHRVMNLMRTPADGSNAIPTPATDVKEEAAAI